MLNLGVNSGLQFEDICSTGHCAHCDVHSVCISAVNWPNFELYICKLSCEQLLGHATRIIYNTGACRATPLNASTIFPQRPLHENLVVYDAYMSTASDKASLAS